jgi:hypothetical protein
VRCTLPPSSSSDEFILSASNTNDPFNPGNNTSFSDDIFRVVQDEVARIKVVVRPLNLTDPGCYTCQLCTQVPSDDSCGMLVKVSGRVTDALLLQLTVLLVFCCVALC